LRDLFRRKGLLLVPILLLVGLFRLPDFVSGVMANPLYIDLGFAKTDIANVSKLYGVWIGIAGAFAGGFALTRIGLWPALLIGAVVASSSHLMLAWLAELALCPAGQVHRRLLGRRGGPVGLPGPVHRNGDDRASPRRPVLRRPARYPAGDRQSAGARRRSAGSGFGSGPPVAVAGLIPGAGGRPLRGQKRWMGRRGDRRGSGTP
jgi:hypothetical protein